MVVIISPLIESMLPGWNFQATNVNGHSRGITLGYKPCTIHILGTWGGIGFLGVDIYSTELGTKIRMVNIYGPYHRRENFWERILEANIFQSDNIILGGDLNFSLGYLESWGHHPQADPLAGFFKQLLNLQKLIYVPSTKLAPTWRNKRSGEDSIASSLDRFLIKEQFLE